MEYITTNVQYIACTLQFELFDYKYALRGFLFYCIPFCILQFEPFIM